MSLRPPPPPQPHHDTRRQGQAHGGQRLRAAALTLGVSILMAGASLAQNQTASSAAHAQAPRMTAPAPAQSPAKSATRTAHPTKAPTAKPGAQSGAKAGAKSNTRPKTKSAAPKHPPYKPGTRALAASAALAGPLFAESVQAMDWAAQTAAQKQMDREWVQKQLGQARRLPQVEKWVLPPSSPSAKNWTAYRARFIEPKRIQAGVHFWQRHRQALERAEREYGVPASLIVGIIGVETLYGQNTGNIRVLDALATLAFHFPESHPRAPARQAFFRAELAEFLQLTSRSGVDPLGIRGSYAGAMGLPQFMPSSWVRFAVDFDGDGRIDLFDSPQDAIGSVANYFKAFDWRPGMPTHYPVSLTPGQTQMDTLLAPDILPTFSVDRFVGHGASLQGPALQHTGPLALIELLNGPDAPSYVAGTENFYAITRYNWSSYYAMAVIELAEAVARAVKAAP